MLLLKLYTLPLLLQGALSATKTSEGKDFDLISKEVHPVAAKRFNKNLQFFDSNLTAIGTDYLSENTLYSKKFLIGAKIENLKGSQAEMQSAIEAVQSSLSPFVPPQTTKKICTLYRISRTRPKKFILTKSGVPDFLADAVSLLPLFNTGLSYIRSLHKIYSTIDKLAAQSELKAGVIAKVQQFYTSFQAVPIPDSRRDELENAISINVDYKSELAVKKWLLAELYQTSLNGLPLGQLKEKERNSDFSRDEIQRYLSFLASPNIKLRLMAVRGVFVAANLKRTLENSRLLFDLRIYAFKYRFNAHEPPGNKLA